MDVRQTELSEEISENLGRIHVKVNIGQKTARAPRHEFPKIDTESFNNIKYIRGLEIGR